MMTYIWTFFIAFSVITAAFTGEIHNLSGAIIGSGYDAVNLCLKLLGMLCLWNGLMNIAEKSGLSEKIGKLLSPVLRLIFKESKKDETVLRAISMNVTANLLGLGNAATPLGIEAMKRLKSHNKNSVEATNDMIKFVVLNTASIRLIPTTVALLRQSYGAENPMDIIFAVWLSSAAALFAGMSMVYFMQRFSDGNIKDKKR